MPQLTPLLRARRSVWAMAACSIQIAAASTQAHAVTTHLDPDSFALAAGPMTSVEFDDLALGPVCLPVQPYVDTPCTLSVGAVSFTSTVGFAGSQRPELVVVRGLTVDNFALTSPSLPSSADEFYAEFSGTAFGLMLVTSRAEGDTLKLAFANGAGSVLSFQRVVSTGYTFFGVTALPDGAWRVSIFDPGLDGFSAFQIDNVRVAVPEPTTAALALLAGFAVSVLWRWPDAKRPVSGHS